MFPRILLRCTAEIDGGGFRMRFSIGFSKFKGSCGMAESFPTLIQFDSNQRSSQESIPHSSLQLSIDFSSKIQIKHGRL